MRDTSSLPGRGTSLGSSAFMFYLFAYTMATLRSVCGGHRAREKGEDQMNVEEYAGLWSVRPGLAIAMTVFMLALLASDFWRHRVLRSGTILQAALQAPFRRPN